jgi:hypothetical protein
MGGSAMIVITTNIYAMDPFFRMLVCMAIVCLATSAATLAIAWVEHRPEPVEVIPNSKLQV